MSSIRNPSDLTKIVMLKAIVVSTIQELNLEYPKVSGEQLAELDKAGAILENEAKSD